MWLVVGVFAIAWLVILCKGVYQIIFGLKFMKSAVEIQACVLEQEIVERTETDSDGDSYIRHDYFLTLGFDTPDLPQTCKIAITEKEFYATEEGWMITVYYLPNDKEHVALKRDTWFRNGIRLFIMSFVVFLFGCTAFVSMAGSTGV